MYAVVRGDSVAREIDTVFLKPRARYPKALLLRSSKMNVSSVLVRT